MGITDGQLQRMDALRRGVEEAWGMTFDEYAVLCVDDPEEAQRVASRAIKKLHWQDERLM